MCTAYISLVLKTNCTPLPQQQKGLTWSQWSTWKPYSILIHKFNMIIWSIIYFISILLIFPASFRLNCHFKFEKQALFGCNVIILVKKIGWYQDGQFKANYIQNMKSIIVLQINCGEKLHVNLLVAIQPLMPIVSKHDSWINTVWYLSFIVFMCYVLLGLLTLIMADLASWGSKKDRKFQ